MNTIQVLDYGFIILNIILLLIWIIDKPDKRGYAVPALTWLIHAFIFYSVLIAEVLGYFARADEDFFLDWSSYLRLHLLLTMLSSLIIIISWNRLKRRIKLQLQKIWNSLSRNS